MSSFVSPGPQCPCSLSSFKEIFQTSHGALSTTIQAKVGIQVHNNKKNQQPCKTVAGNIHNKQNVSTLQHYMCTGLFKI